MIFARNDIANQIQAFPSKSLCEGNSHIEATTIKVSNVLLINVYKSPSSSMDLFKQLLNQMADLIDKHDKVLLLGDFNEDFLKCNSINNYLNHNFNFNLMSPKLSTHNK